MKETYSIKQVCEVLKVRKSKVYKMVSTLREYFPSLKRGRKNSLRFSKADLEFCAKVIQLQKAGTPLRDIKNMFSKQEQNGSLVPNSRSLEMVDVLRQTLQTMHQEQKSLKEQMEILQFQNQELFDMAKEMKRDRNNEMSLYRNMLSRAIELMAENERMKKEQPTTQSQPSQQVSWFKRAAGWLTSIFGGNKEILEPSR